MKTGDVGAWGRGSLGTWEPGDVGVWGRGSLGTWESGDMGVWGRGSLGTEAINVACLKVYTCVSIASFPGIVSPYLDVGKLFLTN